MTEKDRIKEFLERAHDVHGRQYGYSMVTFPTTSGKVAIVCPTHGVFYQEPSRHLAGAGCRACADAVKGQKRAKEARATFTQRAKALHGDKYDITNAEYTTSGDKIRVICPKHGPFEIRASNFLRGIGCARCGDESMAAKQSTGVEEFVFRARRIHEERYDYSSVEYKSTHRAVRIICRQHGPFYQRPSAHLRGRGCPRCGIEKNANGLRASQQDFIDSCVRVHGSKYDYSRVVYSSQAERVMIVCQTHGSFRQVASKHLAGQGCPRCANRDMSTEKFIERAITVHGPRYDYNDVSYERARGNVTIKCLAHGYFEQRADHHLLGIGCPLCVDVLNSKGVRKIECWLVAMKVTFEREKTFELLKSTRRGSKSFRFDFWIPHLNMIIEFDGRQHFEALSIWGGEDALRRVQENDGIKTAWAAENGIELLRIRFDQENEIDVILRSVIKEGKSIDHT